MSDDDYILGKINFNGDMSHTHISDSDLAEFSIDESIILRKDGIMDDKEKELLLILAEEGAEVTVAASKISRFGRNSVHDGVSNIEALKQEIADVLTVAELLGIDTNDLEEQKMNKIGKLKLYGVIE